MKFFTRDLYERRQSADDAILDGSEEEWEAAVDNYQRHLETIKPHLPAHIRDFHQLLLHDAEVRSLARRGDQLFMVLRKDVPPRDLVMLTYELAAEPTALEPFELQPRDWSRATDFNFDEFDLGTAGGNTYTQEIVFGNGWLLRLRFHDVRFAVADPIYLSSPTDPALAPTSFFSQSA